MFLREWAKLNDGQADAFIAIRLFGYQWQANGPNRWLVPPRIARDSNGILLRDEQLVEYPPSSAWSFYVPEYTSSLDSAREVEGTICSDEHMIYASHLLRVLGLDISQPLSHHQVVFTVSRATARQTCAAVLLTRKYIWEDRDDSSAISRFHEWELGFYEHFGYPDHRYSRPIGLVPGTDKRAG